MDTKEAISSRATAAMYVTTAAFTIVGLVLFVAPAWSAVNFPWKISPMVAMTMGGWYLGSAAVATLIAYRRRWSAVYACALYVIAFSVSEIVVLLVHASLVRLSAALAVPYIGMLAIALVSGLAIVSEWFRQRPKVGNEGAPVRGWMRGLTLFFVVFVFFLAGFAVSGHWIGLNGVIFPEPLSLFTLHSFGAFYFSLAFGALALLRARGQGGLIPYAQGGLVLIVLITAAALVFLSSFNLASHRFQSVYIGVYLLAVAIDGYYLWTQRRQRVSSSATTSAR